MLWVRCRKPFVSKSFAQNKWYIWVSIIYVFVHSKHDVLHTSIENESTRCCSSPNLQNGGNYTHFETLCISNTLNELLCCAFQWIFPIFMRNAVID